jgi:POT family proton-dependent oligopeptide transporter
MVLNGIPNDITGNFNPLTIIICTPILTYFIYPQFERWGRPITPMTRIGLGFLLGSANMIIGAVVQHRIYSTSPCGYFATDCVKGVSKVGLAWLIPLSVLPALGEVFISVTSCELSILTESRELG